MRFSTFSLSDEEAARVRGNLGHCQLYLKENAYHYKPSLDQSFWLNNTKNLKNLRRWMRLTNAYAISKVKPKREIEQCKKLVISIWTSLEFYRESVAFNSLSWSRSFLRLINQFFNPLLRLVKEGNLQSLDLNSPRQAVYMCEIKKEFSAAVDACKPLNTFHVLNKMYFSFLRNKFSETKVNQFFD